MSSHFHVHFRSAHLLVVSLACAVFFFACSTGPSGTPASVLATAADASVDYVEDASIVQDAAPALDANSTQVDAGMMCNMLEHAGETVALKLQSGAAPPPTGGTAADGLYALSAINAYGSASEISYKLRSTLEKRGESVDVLESDDRGDRRKTGDAVVVGTTMRITETCAFPARRLQTERAPFSTTSTEIRLYVNVSGVVVEQIYTRK